MLVTTSRDPSTMTEDNADILALATSEGHRIALIHQAMPKITTSLISIQEYADLSNATGMETNALIQALNSISDTSTDFLPYFNILSQAFLRNGRRTNRFSTELYAALDPFVFEYRQTFNETLAFQDRRTALVKRSTARSNADNIKYRYMQTQQQQQQHQSNTTAYGLHQSTQHQSMGYHTAEEYYKQLDQLGMEAAMSDQQATSQNEQVQLIGDVLQKEVHRITHTRRKEFRDSLKVICSSMKEVFNERVAVWENVKQQVVNLDAKNGYAVSW